ncbi:hypothetical protein [Sphingomonas psychrotolerans]|uniref:hypothetical protein n=1 Tax=Sphingomonas psychrotolerans TaxID=1327635 RepID=UPI001F22CBD7|nr:hypothetical protein [Sphingomonas psychrotolerans]
MLRYAAVELDPADKTPPPRIAAAGAGATPTRLYRAAEEGPRTEFRSTKPQRLD